MENTRKLAQQSNITATSQQGLRASTGTGVGRKSKAQGGGGGGTHEAPPPSRNRRAAESAGPRVPKLCRHRNERKGDLAYMTVGGQRLYLGQWGTQQAHERYGRMLAELLANGGRPLPRADDKPTITQIIAAYLEHAEQYYGFKHSTTAGIARACKPLKDNYGSVSAESFRPCDLLVLQALYVKTGNCRTQCNRNLAFVRRMFKWAVSRGLVSLPVYQAICTVEGLRRGHTTAPEGRTVAPVPWETVKETLPWLSRPMAGLVQLLWATGARPGEVVGLRATMIDTSGPVWRCELKEHKNAHKGQQRVLWFGPDAQEVLREFMSRRGITDVLFSPEDALVERSDTRTGDGRRENQQPTPRLTDRTVGEQYHPQKISQAIDRAVATRNQKLAEKLGRPLKEAEILPHWFAYQLRHSFATRARAQFGIEGARVALGHADVAITMQYAEADQDAAKEVARRLG